jgi:hypothetical protein
MRAKIRALGLALVLAMSGCTASAPIAFACPGVVKVGMAPAKPCPPRWLYAFNRTDCR